MTVTSASRCSYTFVDAGHGIRAPYRDGRHPQDSDLQQQVILQFPLYLITFAQECKEVKRRKIGFINETRWTW